MIPTFSKFFTEFSLCFMDSDITENKSTYIALKLILPCNKPIYIQMLIHGNNQINARKTKCYSPHFPNAEHIAGSRLNMQKLSLVFNMQA
jgi:hypothetical protein